MMGDEGAPLDASSGTAPTGGTPPRPDRPAHVVPPVLDDGVGAVADRRSAPILEMDDIDRHAVVGTNDSDIPTMRNDGVTDLLVREGVAGLLRGSLYLPDANENSNEFLGS
jgi:hypothetical protein